MVGLPMWNIFSYRLLSELVEVVAHALQALEKARFPEFLFQMLEIEEVRILVVIRRVLHGLVQNIEFGHTVVECSHILLQIAEYLLLDELIETGLIESVAFKACILDKVVEESGKP